MYETLFVGFIGKEAFICVGHQHVTFKVDIGCNFSTSFSTEMSHVFGGGTAGVAIKNNTCQSYEWQSRRSFAILGCRWHLCPTSNDAEDCRHPKHSGLSVATAHFAAQWVTRGNPPMYASLLAFGALMYQTVMSVRLLAHTQMLSGTSLGWSLLSSPVTEIVVQRTQWTVTWWLVTA